MSLNTNGGLGKKKNYGVRIATNDSSEGIPLRRGEIMSTLRQTREAYKAFLLKRKTTIL